MKICHVVSVYPRSQEDSEVPWLRKSINKLRAEGHDITIYAPSFKGLKDHEIDGCPVKRFRYFFAGLETLTHDEGAPNKIHKFHYKLITLFYLFFGTLGLIRLHSKEKFDVLHVHWPAPHALFGFIASLFCKTKIVLSFYTASLMLVKRFPFVKHFLRFFIKHSDHVIAISQFTGKLVTDIYDRNLTIIPYGTTVSPEAETPKLLPNKKIISVGRVIERKGFKYLIDAMPSLLEKYPDATLQIIGGGPHRENLMTQAKELGIEEKVTLPGKVSQEDLEKAFNECNVFVLPSIVDSKGDTEGLGVVLIEAMTYHKPVIGTDTGGITDIVINDVSGIRVPQKDSKAIYNALDKLFSNHEYAKEIAEKGFEHVEKNFSWRSVIGKFNQVYESVCK